MTPVRPARTATIPELIRPLPDDLASARVLSELHEAMDARTRALLTRSPRLRRRIVMPRMLVAADLVGLTLAYAVGMRPWQTTGRIASLPDLVLFAVSLAGWVWLGKLQGLYHRDDERADHCTTDDVVGVFYLTTAGAWLLLVASRLEGLHGPDLSSLIVFWLLGVVAVPICRTAARRYAKLSTAYIQNTVIVGAGDIGQLICRKLIKHPEYGANVVGFVDRHPKERRPDLPEHLTVLGTPEHLPQIVRQLDVERVIVAFSDERSSDLLATLRPLRGTGVQIDLVPWLFELIGPRVSVHTIEGLPLVGLTPSRPAPTARVSKRFLDIVCSAAALVVLSPVMVLIAWSIRRDSRGPVLFRQTRLGIGMKDFTALKFRTMKIDTDPAAHRDYIRQSMLKQAPTQATGLYKLDRSDAVTGVGRWLRKTSLDELPQLINVLKGDMSLVGPRPCIPYEAENFGPHHLERFQVPQGLTGLWQVTARANSTYLEALDLDVAYVRDWSLGLDLRLLMRTPLALIRQRGSTT